jgi:acetoin utilization deacetylase AcuC-like enzyme
MIHISYHPSYKHELPDKHKFPMLKYSELVNRIKSEKIFTDKNFFSPLPIEENLLTLTHTEEYINKVKKLELEHKEERRMGFPQSKELYIRELIITNGTLQGAELAKENGLSFNIAGGTHHGFSYKGEGFCIFNDIAVAANAMLFDGKVRKVLVIDLDVHQGNGTAEIFTNEPRVFTYSVHGKNNYPLKKEISDKDTELDDLTGDNDYLNIISDEIPYLLDSEKPDFVFYQAGVDVLESDKFGRLSLSIEGTKKRDEIVFSECKKRGLPISCTMGGGYSKDLNLILEAHLNTYRVGKNYYD